MSNCLECITLTKDDTVKPVWFAFFFPLYHREIRFNWRSIGKHGCQSTTKLAQGEEMGLDIVPNVIEKCFVMGSIQNFPNWGFASVDKEQILMTIIDFFNLFSQLIFFQMLMERIRDIANENTRLQLY